ncbi:SIMPL domain-containing protein [Desulfovibrio mangrovi]|uniref:SIMPL domain-containing protein n=1 Tax=Desulfovibrio mangrovi TaxID=2976983 RepID=UPI0022450F88|nr:SIMPL domain-containing protein [Desulfovibrio mangrovi]UZP68095.1 SIMPL domain-containing protein [Desulfovibrio mangrovi]
MDFKSQQLPFGNAGLITAALALAASIVIASIVLGDAMGEFKAYDRYVSVKGLAEREYPADSVIWPISFTVTGNDLPALQKRIEESEQSIREFLATQSLGDSQTTRSTPRITDHYAYGGNPDQRPPHRYSAEAVLTIRSNKIQAVKEAMTATGALLAKGVMLVYSYDYQPKFDFTRLNEVKPEMIAAATKNAREAANQFAADSGNRVGSIRQARQGVFSIEQRDPYSPEIKVLRVVTSVDFFLEQ